MATVSGLNFTPWGSDGLTVHSDWSYRRCHTVGSAIIHVPTIQIL